MHFGQTPCVSQQIMRRNTMSMAMLQSSVRRLVCTQSPTTHRMAPTEGIHIDTGAVSRPHPRKKGPGEDAHFITSVAGSSGRVCMGVADGVGGAGNSGEYASMLMAAAEAHHVSHPTHGPFDILASAWRDVSERLQIEGRSTASIVLLDALAEPPLLHGVNLGDSGWLLLRWTERGRLRIAHRSKAGTHAFNCPHQLGVHLGVELNSPADADVARDVPLMKGDLLLLATDGLFDVMYDLEILELIAGARRDGQSATAIATLLVDTARALALDGKRLSPVVVAMQAQDVIARPREVQDDVTVAVAHL